MEPVYEVRSLVLVEVGDHLGVAARRERVPGALQAGAQLAVVVDLAVETTATERSSLKIG